MPLHQSAQTIRSASKLKQDTNFLASCISSAWRKPYRGSISEYSSQLNLQEGYSVRGRFDIHTVRHIIEPLEAIHNPKVRIVVIQGAVQTTKSLIADIVVPFWIEHDPGDCLWLFEDDPKAKLYAENRAMPLIRAKPEIAAMLEGVDRNDKTKTRIKFKHMNLVLGGLNEGNVQSLSWRYVIIDEAWMARANGLIRQAIDRTKQYPDTKKVIIIGQGGYEDEDFDRLMKETDVRVLHYACPSCGFYQPFDLTRLRDENFPVENLRGSYSGLSWDTNEKTRPKERWNFEEVGKTAHHRCFQCDYRIEDTPEIRRKLNDSYRYFPTNPSAPSNVAGFMWPGEASMRVKFSDLAVKYLRAKVALEELAYQLPMQEYYMKDRGLTWSESSTDEYRAPVQENYDVKSEWAEEKYRVLIADCQRDLKKFFAGVFAISLAGEVRELARETVESFEALAQMQAYWKVLDQRVFLDCGYEMTRVLRECVQHGHVGTIKLRGQPKKIWLCWTGLKGSPQEVFQHTNPKTKVLEWRIYSPRKLYDVNVGTDLHLPRAPWYEWSNLHCKDLLRPRRDGDAGVPKFRTLPDSLPQTDMWSHFAQMRSEKRVEAYQGGKKKAIWLPVKETRPNHEWDKAAMVMAVCAIMGVIGSSEDAETEHADDSASQPLTAVHS